MNRQTRCPSCMQPGYEGTLCPHCGYNGTNPNAPHQLSVGAVLKEQYRIGKVLGQGGFGITYLGWDLYLDMAVAIKEYYPGGLVMRDSAVTMTVSELSGTQAERFRNSRDRFLREAKMLARFSQLEEVVQVRNFFLANNTAYIVMEYVEGITLKQYVKQQGGRLEGQETLKRMESIIRTLAKVHRTGIVHRDISPDNIMVLPDGGMKLLDFGAVRTVTGAAVDKELTHSTEAILKQGYAPLEQYQKKGALGPWTDVYALCATVYSCITGSSPPDAPSRVLDGEELDRKHLAGLTESQQNALLHGLELRAEQRTPDMQTLYRELYAPEPQPEPERRPKAKKRFGALAWVSLAGIAAVLLAAVLMGVPKDAPEPPVQTLAGAALLDSGSCGANLNWTLTEDGVLTVTGSGEMYNYYGPWYAQELLPGRRQAPWNDYRDRITAVILEDGVTTVGDAAFYGCPGLTRVELGSGIVLIGMDAFMDAPLTGRFSGNPGIHGYQRLPGNPAAECDTARKADMGGGRCFRQLSGAGECYPGRRYHTVL